MTEAERQLSRRARWAHDKRVERARKNHRSTEEVPKQVVAAIMQERDRRVAAFASRREGYPYQLWAQFERVSNSLRHHALLGDVWAARMLLTQQRVKTGPSAIAAWLRSEGRTHGYSQASLRVVIARSLERIQLLETTPSVRRPLEMIWPPFDPSPGSATVLLAPKQSQSSTNQGSPSPI